MLCAPPPPLWADHPLILRATTSKCAVSQEMPTMKTFCDETAIFFPWWKLCLLMVQGCWATFTLKFVVRFKQFILDGYEDPEGVRRWLELMTLLGRIGQLVQTQGTSGKERGNKQYLKNFTGYYKGYRVINISRSISLTDMTRWVRITTQNS